MENIPAAAAPTAAAAATTTAAAAPNASADTSTVPAAAVANPAVGPTVRPTGPTAGETQKWKQVVDGYRSSNYFKIRSIARDLRPFVAEVLQAPDIRRSNAAQEILIKAKFMIELLKEMKAETGFTAELKKHKGPGLSDAKLKKHKEPGLSDASKDVPMGKPQSTEIHAPAQPQSGGKHVAPEKQDKPGKQEKPEKQYVSKKARKASSGKVPEAKITALKESEKQLDGELPLSYVVGGSPIGWNFLLFPGGEAIYYGVTKESARLRQAAK